MTKECPSSVAVTIRTPGLGVILRRLEERGGERAFYFRKAIRLAVLKGPPLPSPLLHFLEEREFPSGA
ncbi:MAG: hypothetical protein DME26_08775 [Verrucomicrobia bacterium]|nr:MAG: hypothetical protein DME26_08775 [Verrucomicrobiota bacterium]